MLKKTVSLLLLWKVWVLILALLATLVLPFQERFASQHFGEGFPYLLKIWGNFDGFQYMRIAETGYRTDNIPFFPLYPLLMYVLHIALRIPFLIGGLVIAHLSFFLALFVMFQLFKKDRMVEEWSLFLLLLLFFPTGFFYGAVYNDSLFLLWSVCCIYFSRQQHWMLATLAGALATLARLNGLALAVFMSMEFLRSFPECSPKVNWKKMLTVEFLWKLVKQSVASGFWTVVAIPLTYVGYLSFIQVEFGSWQKIHEAMVVWGQNKIVFPPIVFYRYIKIFLTVQPFGLLYVVALIEFIFATFHLFLCIFLFKKIRFSYWVLAITSFTIPTLTGTFAGMPRYALHLFPFFLGLVVLWKRMDRVQRGIFVAYYLLLEFFIIMLFTRGYFIT